jgi:hypothetical protein
MKGPNPIPSNYWTKGCLFLLPRRQSQQATAKVHLPLVRRLQGLPLKNDDRAMGGQVFLREYALVAWPSPGFCVLDLSSGKLS